MTIRLRNLVLLVGVSATVTALGAQQATAPAPAQPPTAKGVIVGTIVDAATNQPIPNATVNVSPDGNRTRTTVVADDKGRYVFSEAPAGHLFLTSAAPGYMGGYYGIRSPFGANQFFDLTEGETATGVVIRMWKNAIVTGTVTDDKGDPMVGATVMASRVQVIGGRTSFGSGRQIKTDDRGTYRSVDLVPGEYAIVLMSPAAVTAASTMQSGGSYPTFYYPDAVSTSNATVLQLNGGDERSEIDFHVTRQAAFSVSGVVSGRLDGQTRPVQLTLKPADRDRIPSTADVRKATSDAQGHFTFRVVLPGSYVIETMDVPSEQAPPGTSRMSYQGTGTGWMMIGGNVGGRGAALPLAPLPTAAIRWAATTVTVDDKNLDDVAVALQSSASIKGRLVFDGTAAKPTADILAQTGVMAMADGHDLPLLPAPGIRPDGSFETPGLPPGSYQLMVMLNAPGWTLGSMTADGREMIGRPLALGASDLTGVVLRYLDHPTQISGVVRSESGQPAPDASIYIFPADRNAWAGGGPAAPMREVRPSRTGTFEAPIVAGEYFVAAVELTAREDWRRADVLDTLARSAKTVRVTMGQTATVDLTVAKGK
jgi:hypothetical protein